MRPRWHARISRPSRASWPSINPRLNYNRFMLRYLVPLLASQLLFAQAPEIRTILEDSETAWKRGDLVTFASYYEDSPDTTFIGREITRGGTKAILDRYRRGYPTPEA